VVEEVDGLGVTTVFPADSEVQVRSSSATPPYGLLHQGADAVTIQRLER
jgi:hypothetical protein